MYYVLACIQSRLVIHFSNKAFCLNTKACNHCKIPKASLYSIDPAIFYERRLDRHKFSAK